MVAYTDDSSGPFNIEFRSDQDITLNEFDAESTENLTRLVATSESDVINFFGKVPGDTGVYEEPDDRALLAQFSDKQVNNFWMTMRGNVSFTDNTEGGFSITHEFGTPFDLIIDDDNDGTITFALLALDPVFGAQFEEVINLIT